MQWLPGTALVVGLVGEVPTDRPAVIARPDQIIWPRYAHLLAPRPEDDPWHLMQPAFGIHDGEHRRLLLLGRHALRMAHGSSAGGQWACVRAREGLSGADWPSREARRPDESRSFVLRVAGGRQPSRSGSSVRYHPHFPQGTFARAIRGTPTP